MAQPIKIIVVDDHEFFRKNFVQQLNSIPNLEVIAEASNGLEFLGLLGTHTPDVIFIDIKMPIMDGIEAIKKALRLDRNLKLIGLTMYESRHHVMQLIEAGAKGILFKNANMENIIKSVYEVANGNFYYSNKVHDLI